MRQWIVEQNHVQMDDGHGRSSGVHASGIVKYIAVRAGFLKIDDDEEGPDEVAVLRMSLGLAWEEWLSSRVPGMMYHFGEIEQDGIVMTPDGLTLDATGGRLHEFKLTWKSKRRSENWSKEWYWMAQMKNYCHALGVREAWLHVFWVNGDYQRGFANARPEYAVYGFEFTQGELDSNWAQMLRYKDEAKAEVHGKAEDHNNETPEHTE
jgi:hypothetical protein